MVNKKKKRVIDLISYILLAVFAFICAFPFYWMVVSAIKPDSEIRAAVPSLFTAAPTFKSFSKVLFTAGFLRYIKNSFLVSVAACLISMVIAVMAGYAFSRYYKEKMAGIPDDPRCAPFSAALYDYEELRFFGILYLPYPFVYHVCDSSVHIYDEQLF